MGADGYKPLVGITCDVHASGKLTVSTHYCRAVDKAGGVPVLLPPIVGLAREHARLFDAFVFSGGDDPIMEAFGEPTHPAATKVHPDRQAYELALLDALGERFPERPTLGVCLGMQIMALHAGGGLNQHMPDDTPTHEDHRPDKWHAIETLPGAPEWLAPGDVVSHHRQAVRASGRLRVIARAKDGVIEAIDDPTRPFYVGVQWHPERTPNKPLGQRVYDELIEAARA